MNILQRKKTGVLYLRSTGVHTPYLEFLQTAISNDLIGYLVSFLSMGCDRAELLQEGGPLLGPKSGLLSNTRKWIVWGDTRADKARDYWEGAPGGEQQGWGNPGELLCHVACSLRVYDDGVSFQVVSGQSSCLACIWSDSGSFLGARISLTQEGLQHEGVWEVGRTYYGLASPPSCGSSRILPVSFWWRQHHGPYQTSRCDTSHARGYHCAWPRQWFLSTIP